MKYNLDLSFLSSRPWQKHFIENYKSRNVLVVHRRWGKSVLTIAFLIYRALENKWSYWYVAPFRSQSKQIGWDILNKLCQNIPKVVFNISELKCTLPNWSTITLFWADNQEALRGLDLRWVILDEYKDIPRTLYSEIIAPMINAYKDWFVVYIWTPWGKNAFYDIYQTALKNPKRYYTAHLTIHDTNLLDEEQLESARIDWTDEYWDDAAFRQEYLLDWDVASKYAYYWKDINRMYSEGRFIDNLFDKRLPVYTAWDIWLNDYTCIVFFQYFEGTIRIIDYYENRGYYFDHYYDILSNKPYQYKLHFLPHDITVKEWWSWNTRLEIFEEYFWYDKTFVLKRYAVEDWINAVRALFHKFIFDTSVVTYINKLSEYQPKLDKDKLPTNTPEHSDQADTIRYLATAYNQYIEVEQEFDTEVLQYDFI